ncbi:short chain acyl-coenzyme A dehydrogenase, partial [Lentinula raphanica]
TETEAARLLTHNAAHRKEVWLSFVKEAAMTKCSASKVLCRKLVGTAIDWSGGLGSFGETRGGEVLEGPEDCKISPIFEGTFDFQLQLMFMQKEYTP